MKEQFERTVRIIGEEAMLKLSNTRVLLFGVGGVGSYVAEGLARAGIGEITMVDKDVIDVTNINRQIPALHSTIGMPKVSVMANRIRDINPHCKVKEHIALFLPDKSNIAPSQKLEIDFFDYDYVVDAVDMVTAKIEIISRSRQAGVPVISCMGTGNKLDAGMFKITDIMDTKVCPLAKVMRRELKKRGIGGVKVIYSEEEPKAVGGSISFVPSVAGLMIAGEVVKDIIACYNK